MPESKRDSEHFSSLQLNFQLNALHRSSIIFYIFHLLQICKDQFFNFVIKLEECFWRSTKTPESKRDSEQFSSFQLNFQLNALYGSSIIFYIFQMNKICKDQFVDFVIKLKECFWRCTKMPDTKQDSGQPWTYQLNFQLNALQRSSIKFFIFYLSKYFSMSIFHQCIEFKVSLWKNSLNAEVKTWSKVIAKTPVGILSLWALQITVLISYLLSLWIFFNVHFSSMGSVQTHFVEELFGCQSQNLVESNFQDSCGNLKSLNVQDNGSHFLSSISLNIFQCPFFINGFSTNSFCGRILWMPRSKRDRK